MKKGKQTGAKATRHIQAVLAGKERFGFSDDWGYLAAPKGLDTTLVVQLWKHVAGLGDALDFIDPWEQFETHLIWNQWDGEDDSFDVTRLDGIEVLVGLERLDLELASITDLSPLIRLASLEHLSVEGQVEDLSPLLGLRKLKSVSVSADRTAENKNVLAELRARKVRVA